MASPLHELFVELFVEHPELLLPTLDEPLELGGALPRFRRGESASSQIPPLRADLTLELHRPDHDDPFAAGTVEIQLNRDDDKPYSWLHYHSGLHYRLRIPTFLVVVTNDPEVATWAAGPFHSGMVTIRPWVIGPANVPVIATPQEARAALPQALLSGMVHGREPVAAEIGTALAAALDDTPDDVGALYWDTFLTGLDGAMRRMMEMQRRDWTPRSDWGKEHFAKGKAAGRASDILELLDIRGLPPDPKLRERILTCTDLEQLGRWFRRAATARSLDDLLAT
ncbi:hypothetical protein [Paraliomyxa miuraensis]|uniref:hypothetical protein n=1 Tax=Paraliomyxa miuraensis TaxID=376150 RepID=UPI0022526B3F|nr:hypothetical protein [Paraliomyxa miuraensis]MCX4242500.1 hypothetical protein [Paraliomyxa miuraensis]